MLVHNPGEDKSGDIFFCPVSPNTGTSGYSVLLLKYALYSVQYVWKSIHGMSLSKGIHGVSCNLLSLHLQGYVCSFTRGRQWAHILRKLGNGSLKVRIPLEAHKATIQLHTTIWWLWSQFARLGSSWLRLLCRQNWKWSLTSTTISIADDPWTLSQALCGHQKHGIQVEEYHIPYPLILTQAMSSVCTKKSSLLPPHNV